jgi:hypothetical protein
MRRFEIQLLRSLGFGIGPSNLLAILYDSASSRHQADLDFITPNVESVLVILHSIRPPILSPACMMTGSLQARRWLARSFTD